MSEILPLSVTMWVRKIMKWLENSNQISIQKFEKKKSHKKYVKAEVKSKQIEYTKKNNDNPYWKCMEAGDNMQQYD